mgnify:CR=1 FL=1
MRESYLWMMDRFKRIVKGLLLALAALVALGIAALVLLQVPAVQEAAVRKALRVVETRTGYDASVDRFDLRPFRRLEIEGFVLHRPDGDTLAAVDRLSARIAWVDLLGRSISLGETEVDGLVVDLVTGGGRADTVRSGPTPANAWTIDPGRWIVDDVRVRLRDTLTGLDLQTVVNQGVVDVRSLDPGHGAIDVKEVRLTRPEVRFRPGRDTGRPRSPITTFDIGADLHIDAFSLTDGSFDLDTDSAGPGTSWSRLFLDVGDLTWRHDTLQACLRGASGRDAGGFTLSRLTADLRVTDTGAELDNLLARTPRSTVGRRISVGFDDPTALSDPLHAMRADIDLERTRIDLADVAYFADLGPLHDDRFELSGNIRGSFDNLKVRDLRLTAGRETVLEGQASLRGLPAWRTTSVIIDVDRFHTRAGDAEWIVDGLALPPTVHRLGSVDFEGTMLGLLTDFVMDGSATTDIGRAETDLNFKLTGDDGMAAYSGNLALHAFDLGRLFDRPDELGKTSFKVSLRGTGLDLPSLDAELTGQMDSFVYRGYVIRDFALNGRVRDRFFEGVIDANDEHLDARFDGRLDLSQDVPLMAFEADIDLINFKRLDLTGFPIALRGTMRADLAASDLDEMRGRLSFDSLVVNSRNEFFDVGGIDIEVHNTAGRKSIDLESDLVTGSIDGLFYYDDLADLVRTVVLDRAPDPDRPSGQYVAADLSITDRFDALAGWNEKLGLDSTVTLSAYLGEPEDRFSARLSAPRADFDRYRMDDLEAHVVVGAQTVHANLYLGRLTAEDSVLLSDLRYDASGTPTAIDHRLELQGPTDDYAIGLRAQQTRDGGEHRIEFLPSNILINDKYWSVLEDNRLIIDRGRFFSHNLGIEHFGEEIRVVFNHMDDAQNVQFLFRDIELADIVRIPTKQRAAVISGRLNGDVVVAGLPDDPAVYGAIDARGLQMNENDIGDLTLRADVIPDSRRIALSGDLTGQQNDLGIRGYYSITDRSTPRDLNLIFDVRALEIASIEDVIPDYITDSEGTVTGEVRITGSRERPNLLGFLDINAVNTTVSYLNTTYFVSDERVTFDANGIDLGEVTVHDADGNPARGRGRINHKHFKDFALDILVTSEKVQGINTRREHNDQFYGTAYLNGGARFSGPTNNLLIEVFGETVGASFLDIPLDRSRNEETYAFYEFVQPETEEDPDADRQTVKLKGTAVNLKLELTQDAEINLILDEEAGDVLKTRGEGDVEIDVNSNGELNLYGLYTITDGDYLFTLQRIINKRFRIDPGSAIRFNGPLEEAQIDVQASYNLRATTFNLIQDYLNDLSAGNIDAVASRAQNRIPVKLLLNLSGPLPKPEVGFAIDLDINDPQLRNAVEGKMALINQNENELNRQVFGLLVLNQFIPTNGAGQDGLNTIQTGATNTVSEFLSTQLTGYFNDWLSTFVEDLDFSINYRSYDQLNTYSEFDLQRRRELQLALSKRFLDDRLSIAVGGNIDFGQDYYDAEQTNTNFAGDATVQYAITKDRRLRAKAFTTTDYDIFQQAYITRAGLGLSYQREYDDVRDFFKMRQRTSQSEPTDTTAAPPSENP